MAMPGLFSGAHFMIRTIAMKILNLWTGNSNAWDTLWQNFATSGICDINSEPTRQNTQDRIPHPIISNHIPSFEPSTANRLLFIPSMRKQLLQQHAIFIGLSVNSNFSTLFYPFLVILPPIHPHFSHLPLTFPMGFTPKNRPEQPGMTGDRRVPGAGSGLQAPAPGGVVSGAGRRLPSSWSKAGSRPGAKDPLHGFSGATSGYPMYSHVFLRKEWLNHVEPPTMG